MQNKTRMPAVFIGHGNPMNAISDNPYRDAWRALGTTLPRPQAILCISAHWQSHGTQVCAVAKPRTIHDFGGFPPALFAAQYTAPGAPEFAQLTRDLFAPAVISLDYDWGLDHGAWTILQALFPNADVPVLQLSLDLNLDFAAHFALAKQLAVLRTQGVMIIGSGNIVHNLSRLNPNASADWALAFDRYIKTALETNDEEALIHIERAGSTTAKLAVPTAEHYLPLLYVAAVRHGSDQMRFLTESFDLGTLSMRSVIYA